MSTNYEYEYEEYEHEEEEVSFEEFDIEYAPSYWICVDWHRPESSIIVESPVRPDSSVDGPFDSHQDAVNCC